MFVYDVLIQTVHFKYNINSSIDKSRAMPHTPLLNARYKIQSRYAEIQSKRPWYLDGHIAQRVRHVSVSILATRCAITKAQCELNCQHAIPNGRPKAICTEDMQQAGRLTRGGRVYDD
jgi:hypothetical protein